MAFKWWLVWKKLLLSVNVYSIYICMFIVWKNISSFLRLHISKPSHPIREKLNVFVSLTNKLDLINHCLENQYLFTNNHFLYICFVFFFYFLCWFLNSTCNFFFSNCKKYINIDHKIVVIKYWFLIQFSWFIQGGFIFSLFIAVEVLLFVLEK